MGHHYLVFVFPIALISDCSFASISVAFKAFHKTVKIALKKLKDYSFCLCDYFNHFQASNFPIQIQSNLNGIVRYFFYLIFILVHPYDGALYININNYVYDDI